MHASSLCQLHSHTCPLYNVLLEVVVVVFQEKNCLNITLSQSSISLPSFTFVNAAVSEIRELNQNKEKN